MDGDYIKAQLNEWYHEYSNDLFHYIFFMVGEREQAKDILQDTFIRAYQKHDSFNGEHVKSWLFRIARNLTIDYFRRKKPISYFLDFIPAVKSTDHGPEQIALLNETERLLYLALSRLKRDYRDVIILRKIKEFSIAESAEILDWSENRVKVNLFRGMKELKKELEKEGFTSESLLRRSE